MAGLREVRMIGLGKDLPGPPMTNAELLDVTNLTDEEWTKEKALEWTTRRLGIVTRHVTRDKTNVPAYVCSPGCENSSLCANAIRRAAENAGCDLSEIDLIIVATATPDYPVPGTSPLVQEKLNIPECSVMDIRSACCGSLTAFTTAIQYLQTGHYRTVAVVGCDVGSMFGNLDKDSETYTREDFVNALMIGDGAGAVILRGFSENEAPYGIEILHYHFRSIGTGKKPGMWLPLGGSKYPGTLNNISSGLGAFKHDYRAVLEHGPILFTSAMEKALNDTNLSISDISLFVPHQANGQIADLAPKFGVPKERMFQNFERYGNTANASVMLCMADIAEENNLGEGDLVLVASAESTKWLHAAILLRWTSMTGEKRVSSHVRDPWYRRMYASFAFWFVRQLLWARALFFGSRPTIEKE